MDTIRDDVTVIPCDWRQDEQVRVIDDESRDGHRRYSDCALPTRGDSTELQTLNYHRQRSLRSRNTHNR